MRHRLIRSNHFIDWQEMGQEGKRETHNMETVGTVSMTLVAQVMTLAAHLDRKSEQGCE